MTPAQIATAARSNPALRSSVLLGLVPLGLSLVTAGLAEMDRLVAARRRQLERLEDALRAVYAEAELQGLSLDGLVEPCPPASAAAPA